MSRGATRINTNRIAMLFYFRTRRCIFIARPRIFVHLLVYSVTSTHSMDHCHYPAPCLILHGIKCDIVVVLASYKISWKIIRLLCFSFRLLYLHIHNNINCMFRYVCSVHILRMSLSSICNGMILTWPPTEQYLNIIGNTLRISYNIIYIIQSG